MDQNIATLQANAERLLSRTDLDTKDGHGAARDTINALTTARQTHSELLKARSDVAQLQLAVEQVNSTHRVERVERNRIGYELGQLRTAMAASKAENSRHYAKAKAGKAAVVAQLREALAALRTIRDVNEDENLGTGATAVRIGRAYDAILTD
jgi:hypothetical protein